MENPQSENRLSAGVSVQQIADELKLSVQRTRQLLRRANVLPIFWVGPRRLYPYNAAALCGKSRRSYSRAPADCLHCWRCDETHAIAEGKFYRDSSKANGYDNTCKACRKVLRDAWKATKTCWWILSDGRWVRIARVRNAIDRFRSRGMEVRQAAPSELEAEGCTPDIGGTYRRPPGEAMQTDTEISS